MGAAERSTVFNLTTSQRTELDDVVHEHFGKLYEVVDVNVRGRIFTNAKGISGFGPTKPVYVEDRCVRGNVLVLYVIAADGSVASAYAAKSTDRLLSDLAVQSMTERRFQPAQVDGRVVPIVAGSSFIFNCPP